MNSVHQIDSVRHITGLDFVRAMAETATLSASVEVEDSAGAILRLSNGGLATLVANAHSHGAKREETITIDGEFGRIDVSDAYSADTIRLFLRREAEDYSVGEWNTVPAPRRDRHAAMIAAFVEAVRTRSPAPATAADAAAALATILAIYESAASGTQVSVRM
jgi:predicted dehydrogenase